MLGRLGPAFTRQAMGEWVGQAAGLLQPVYDELKKLVRLSGYIQGDETSIRVLNPSRGRPGGLAVNFPRSGDQSARLRLPADAQTQAGARLPARF